MDEIYYWTGDYWINAWEIWPAAVSLQRAAEGDENFAEEPVAQSTAEIETGATEHGITQQTLWAAVQRARARARARALEPDLGLSNTLIGNTLIESFVGSEDRAASQVPIAPSHTDLGVAQMGAFDLVQRFYRTDGTFCRVRQGRKPKEDAQLQMESL